MKQAKDYKLNLNDMGHRIRTLPTAGLPVLADALQYDCNHATSLARKVSNHWEHFEIEIWFDKHYYIRMQHGDENGKREGIEQERVKRLVITAVKHLCYYAHILESFTFLNLPGQAKRLFRILLKDHYSGATPLNVIVEFHFLDILKYEATIKTAMQSEDFRPNEGQYIVDLYDTDTSVLSKKTIYGVKQICAL
jgi:hypothetical protein